MADMFLEQGSIKVIARGEQVVETNMRIWFVTIARNRAVVVAKYVMNIISYNLKLSIDLIVIPASRSARPA